MLGLSKSTLDFYKISVMNTIPIAFTFDERLLLPSVVCITSLLENAGFDTFYDIYIIYPASCAFDRSNLSDLERIYPCCKMNFIPIEDEFLGAYEVRGITTTAYYRLLIPDLIPQYDKILYSDVDVIFRDDLKGFYSIDIGNNYFGAVDVAVSIRPDIRKYVTEILKLDYKKGYFYSGNLIINCKEIKKDNLIDEFRRLSLNNYLYQDMDIMNIACNGRIYKVDLGFCLTNYLYSLVVNQRDLVERVYTSEAIIYSLERGIIHYNGAKPWSDTSMNSDVWWYYYRKSIVFDDKLVWDTYDSIINKCERWTFIKRLKHLIRYFAK